MMNEVKDTDAADSGAVDMRENVRLVAEHVTTPAAALALWRAGYDSVCVVSSGPERKRWGRLRQLLATGWSDHGAMDEAGGAVRAVAGDVLAMTRRFRDSRAGGGFVGAVVSLSYIAVLAQVVARRERELREAEPAAGAREPDGGQMAAPSVANGGPAENHEPQQAA